MLDTAYTRLTKLRSAIANSDPSCLAMLLGEAEKAHAEYEKSNPEVKDSWPTFYAEYMLGIVDVLSAQEVSADPVPTDGCGVLGGFC